MNNTKPSKIKFPILAIDYGTRRIGLAISDAKGIIATPLLVLTVPKNSTPSSLIKEIIGIASENRAKALLIGIPQSFTEQHIKTEMKINEFAKELKKSSDLPLYTHDESYSTSTAENMLISSGQHTKKFRSKIDKVSAAVCLQEFLNYAKKYNNEHNN